MNIFMQSTAVTLFKVQSKINALHGKLKIWGDYISRNDIECFENLSSFLKFNKLEFFQETKDSIRNHLTCISQTLKDYYPVTYESKL